MNKFPTRHPEHRGRPILLGDEIWVGNPEDPEQVASPKGPLIVTEIRWHSMSQTHWIFANDESSIIKEASVEDPKCFHVLRHQRVTDSMRLHHHEDHQIRPAADGGRYCAGCGRKL